MPATLTADTGSEPSGFALIASTILTALLLTLGTFFISTSSTDLRIATAHNDSTQTYYLAEAAVADFTAQLRNDLTLFNAFEAGTLTPANSSRTRQAVFHAGDSYTVYAQSTAPATADIFATARAVAHGANLQRQVHVSITRATASVTEWPYALSSGGAGGPENGNIDIREATTVNGGVLHANRTLQVHNQASLTVNNGRVEASGNVVVSSGGTLTLINSTQAEGVPIIAMPQIDFDSSAPTSWKSRATQVMTTQQFDALPSGTTLTGIIFVDGTPADLQKNLDVQGVLVINGDFELKPPGQLTIRNHPNGSGLLVKNDLAIESQADLYGLVYAGHRLEIDRHSNNDPPLIFTVTGGLVGFNIVIQPPRGSSATINYNQTAVVIPLDPHANVNSPLVSINHWEEQY